jgi:hypothetical protein
MRFTVEGADLKTGDDRTIIISATDAKDAEDQARKMGLVVSRIWANETESPASPAPPSEAAAMDMPMMAAAMTLNAPDYPSLKTMSRVFSLMAFVGYLVAILSLAIAAFFIFNTVRTQSDEAKTIAIDSSLVAIITALGAIIAHGVSAFFSAFRDLVRNSFRWG